MQSQANAWDGRQRSGPRPKGNNALIRAIGYLKKQRTPALLAYGALVVATIAQLAVPQLTQNMLDAVTNGTIARQLLKIPDVTVFGVNLFQQAIQKMGWTVDQVHYYADNAQSLLIQAALILVCFAAARAVFSFTQAFMAEKTSQGVAFDFRNAIFAKIQRLSFSYHDQNQTGQLMIRATDDVEKVRLFIAQGLVMAVQAILLLSCTLVILLLTNWRLTLVILPILPIALVLFLFFGMVTQPLFTQVQRRIGVLNTRLQESLAGIRVVKAFAQEPRERARFNAAADDLMQYGIRVNRILSVLFPIVFLMAQIGQALLLYFGGKQILGGTVTYGEYLKFSLYLAYVFFPVGMLGMIITLMSQASASATRIFEILDAKSDIEDKPNAIDMPPIKGHVEFKNVTFRYFGSGAPVL
ncbi:MAG TPA: ABC transporter ATP-binding protein, partial [Aggregatilineales bacterium]|nr:ABC transporter ATP-binding protein [Aggregatilineales bacterium]